MIAEDAKILKNKLVDKAL